MKKLVVLYDAQCDFCNQCQGWLSQQPQYITLQFIPKQSETAKHFYFQLLDKYTEDIFLVIGDQGQAYVGEDAFIMCLYALEQYRELSLSLARPHMKPFARQVVAMISKNRHTLPEVI